MDRQKKYIDEAKRTAQIDLLSMRRFVIDNLADAAAYQRVEGDANRLQTYHEIHRRIFEVMRNLAAKGLSAINVYNARGRME
jgi:hypothetical protein